MEKVSKPWRVPHQWPEAITVHVHFRLSEVMLLRRLNRTSMAQHFVFLPHSHIDSFIGLWDYQQRLFNSVCTWTVLVGVFIYLFNNVCSWQSAVWKKKQSGRWLVCLISCFSSSQYHIKLIKKNSNKHIHIKYRHNLYLSIIFIFKQ